MMNKCADVVVIGAGALGASVAYHLAVRSTLKIVLIDKFAPGSQTSPRAAGMVSLLRKSAPMIALIRRARAKIESFAEELGEPLDWVHCGSLKIARRPADAEVLDDDYARAVSNGVKVDRISLEEACRLNPFLMPKDLEGALHVTEDCYFDPGQIARGYASAAGRLGVEVVSDTPVTEILRSNGTVTGVATSNGIVEARVVVDAAGAWTRQIAAVAGIAIPLLPMRQQVVVTRELPGAAATLPMVRIMDAAVYMRPCQGGFLWGVYEEEPAMFDMASLPRSFSIADLPLDFSVMTRAAQSVKDQLPVLCTAPVREFRGGLPTMTADGHHILGPIPELEGFFFASGCNVAGLSIAPAVGEVMAEWIVDGSPSVEVEHMRATRFGRGRIDESALIEQAIWQYRHFYGAV